LAREELGEPSIGQWFGCAEIDRTGKVVIDDPKKGAHFVEE
jgi:hypothetical protein